MATSNEIISIKQALEHMHSGQPFSCEVYSYDRKRKTGGAIIEYPEARLLGKGGETSEGQADGMPADRPKTRLEQLNQELHDGPTRKPNHRKWYTRNIQILQDGHPTGIKRKIHPALLRTFNHKIVVP